MKKISSILLALVVAVSCSISAYATNLVQVYPEGEPESRQTGSVGIYIDENTKTDYAADAAKMKEAKKRIMGCTNTNDIDIKQIETLSFTKLIFNQEIFLPNTEFVWNMGTEEFLSKVHGADTMNPESELFDAHRYFHSDESNITTFTPPISYVVDGISGEADVAYVFNENGLFKSGYSWTFKNSEAEKLKEAISVLVEDFNSHTNIEANNIEIPDLAKSGEESFPYKFQWSIIDKPNHYIELAVLNLKDNYILQLTIGAFEKETVSSSN